MIFIGSRPLPFDFDILSQCSSITKPCETQVLYGDLPVTAKETIKELLNQPLYWSLPSKYKSAGYFKPLSFKTPAQLEPLSNQTSIMSVSFLNIPLGECSFLYPSGKSSFSLSLYQMLLPFLRTSSSI